MNNFGMVTTADYAGQGAGWGMISNSEFSDLNKALQTGQGIVTEGAGTAGDASKIRLQSIENTLKFIEFQDRHIQLWKDIPKQPAYSTTEEYSKFTAYGSAGGDGFIPEIGTPETYDQSYERDVAYVKFLGVRKATSIVSTLVKNQLSTSMEAHQVKIGTTEMLGLAERNLLWADSRCNDQAWKGIIQQIEEACMNTDGTWKSTDPSFTIVDCKGGPLSPDLLEKHMVRVASSPNYGFISDLYAPFSVFGDFSMLYWAQQIIKNPGQKSGQAAGTPINEYYSTVGSVKFKPLPLLAPNRGIKPNTAGGTSYGSTSQPSILTTGNVTCAAGTNTESELTASQTYYYWISKVWKGYVSQAIAKSATPSTDEAVTITVPNSEYDAALGAYCGIRIWRSTVNDPATASWLADVQKGKQYDHTGIVSGSTNTIYVDTNQNRENTCIAFAVDNDPEQVWRFRQLAPVMKMDLAVVDTSKPFMLLMFGTPIIYNARRTILFRNIGPATVSMA